jgi:hypothetical protein
MPRNSRLLLVDAFCEGQVLEGLPLACHPTVICLHTVSLRVSNFNGRVRIQASLAETPVGDRDWFTPIDGDGAPVLFDYSSCWPGSVSRTDGRTFRGRFRWLRVIVAGGEGVGPRGHVDRVLLND